MEATAVPPINLAFEPAEPVEDTRKVVEVDTIANEIGALLKKAVVTAELETIQVSAALQVELDLQEETTKTNARSCRPRRKTMQQGQQIFKVSWYPQRQTKTQEAPTQT